MIQIRKAKPSDKKTILNLARSTKVFSPEEIICLENDLTDYFENENEDIVLVYEDEKQVFGFVQFGPLPITDKSWMLHWIAVSKKVQKAGIGRKLIERVESIAMDKNARVLFIETSSRKEFETPRNFYMRNGFMPISVVTDYYGIYDSKVIFSKCLLDLTPRQIL